jgi:hypothetical protein
MGDGMKNLLVPLAMLLSLLEISCNPPPPPALPAEAAVSASGWSFAGIPGEKLQTRHYVIYTTAGTRALRQELPGFMESAYSQYLQLTGLADKPAAPMVIYLLGDRGQWAAMTQTVTAPYQQTYLTIQNGGYCYQGVCVLWDLSHVATYSIAAHEGLHQFLFHRVRQPLPAWVEEGLATQMEGFSPSGQSIALSPGQNNLRLVSLRTELSAQRWVGLSDLLESDAGEFLTTHSSLQGPEYYAQLWAMLSFILSEPDYSGGLRRMIAQAEAGNLQPPPPPGAPPRSIEYNKAMSMPVFRQYIDPDLGRFEARYKGYARKLAGLN